MKSTFSISWNKSTQTRKQRKYRYNAPLHLRSKFLSVSLDKKLRPEIGRSTRVRKGDTVKISRGSHRGKSGKVDRVSMKYTKVYVTGIDVEKADGSKVLIPLDPTNLMITELDKSDKNRFSNDKKKVLKKETKK